MSFTAFGACYKAAASLLPPAMDSRPAWAMLFAIARQESLLDERRQIDGPARGFWQFERGGLRGVLDDPDSRPLIRSVLDRLDYDYKVKTSYIAIEHNDVLAFVYARCLLWTEPSALPKQDASDKGWRQYLGLWRPGLPHQAVWANNFKVAWQTAPAK